MEGEGPAASGDLAMLGLSETARLTGAYAWAERRMFELLGAWVSQETSPAARVLFDLHSQQHSWHAELFADRLPVHDSLDRYGLCDAPSSGAELVMELVGAAEGTLLRLVGAGRLVLPRLVAGYALHLERCASVADAPLRRALRLVLRDEIEAWQAIELMIQGFLRTAGDVRAAASHLSKIEEELCGVGPGLVSWSSLELGDRRA